MLYVLARTAAGVGCTSVALNTTADIIAVFFAASLLQSMLVRPAVATWRRRGSGVTLIGMGLVPRRTTHADRDEACRRFSTDD